MSIWTKNINTILRMTGQQCSTLIDGQTTTFYGVFEQQNVLEDANGISVVIAGSSLTVAKSIANKLERQSEIIIDDKTWYVREILFIDDGEIARVSIVTEKDQC